LIDGDQYLYRCCSATERDVKFDDENHVLTSNEEEAWDTLVASIGEVQKHFAVADVVIAHGSSPYFRHKLFPDYKPKRGRKPLCYHDVLERLKKAFHCVQMDGLEADDVMGILATHPANRDSAIIVARDKDMKGVPARLWDGMEFTNVSQEQADYFHMYQTLVGDTADGYKGCPGVGPVKAAKILDSKEPLWPRVVAAYEQAGLTAADALLQARLARILRWSDWDTEKKEPILWSPQEI
jgi:DNA polymerase-1